VAPGAARSLLIVVAELTLEHTVHAAQLLLLAQLQPILRQRCLRSLFTPPAGTSSLHFGLERLHAALQEQVGSFASGELALRPVYLAIERL